MNTDERRSELEQLRDENRRLRAIVAKLPKTADGVPIVPGMTLYLGHSDGAVRELTADAVTINGWGEDDRQWDEDPMTMKDWTGTRVHSSREAALAASKGEVHHG